MTVLQMKISVVIRQKKVRLFESSLVLVRSLYMYVSYGLVTVHVCKVCLHNSYSFG